jgi:hypothetical protein
LPGINFKVIIPRTMKRLPTVGAVPPLLLTTLCALASSNSAAAQTYTLTINTLGSGTVSASPPGPYPAGTLLTLTASAADGWSFSSWSGNLLGYANPGTLLVNDNYAVSATFDQNGYQGITGDSRAVIEPVFPAVCATLLAQQSAGNLDQTLFDTAALQEAIDACPMRAIPPVMPARTISPCIR